MPHPFLKPSDTTDIDVLSGYAPYIDVFCTDAFMADRLRGFAEEYGVTVFHGKTSGLRNRDSAYGYRIFKKRF